LITRAAARAVLHPAAIGTRPNSVASFAIIAAQRLGRVVAIVPAAAVLTREGFAAVVLALALADISRSALHGFDISLVRELSKDDRSRDVLAVHLGGKVLLSGVVGSALAAFAWLAYGTVAGFLTAVSLAGLLPANVAALIAVERQASLRLASIAPYAIATSLLGLVASVVGTLAFRDPLATVAGLALGDLAFFVTLWLSTAPPRPAIATSTTLVRRLPALTATQLGYVAQGRIGVILLGLTAPAVAIGEFGIASRLAEGMIVFAVALTASSYPLMSRALARHDMDEAIAVLRWSARISLVGAASAFGLLVLTAAVWLPVIFPAYPDAVVPFAVMTGAIVLYFGSSQTSAFMNAAHRDRFAAMTSLLGLVAAAGGTVALLPLGALGAAVGRLVGEGVRHVAELVASWRIERRAPAAIVPSLIVAAIVSVLSVLGGLTGGAAVVTGFAGVAAGVLVVVRSFDVPGVLRARGGRRVVLHDRNEN
jgi:O-antigen/teichoic acid export membrane protein